MAQIKFGTQQLKNPTPHNVSMLFDFLAGVCGIVAAFVTTASFIPHNVSDPISSIMTALFIPLLLLAKRFFGVSPHKDEIPAENVNEMETK